MAWEKSGATHFHSPNPWITAPDTIKRLRKGPKRYILSSLEQQDWGEFNLNKLFTSSQVFCCGRSSAGCLLNQERYREDEQGGMFPVSKNGTPRYPELKES